MKSSKLPPKTVDKEKLALAETVQRLKRERDAHAAEVNSLRKKLDSFLGVQAELNASRKEQIRLIGGKEDLKQRLEKYRNWYHQYTSTQAATKKQFSSPTSAQVPFSSSSSRSTREKGVAREVYQESSHLCSCNEQVSPLGGTIDFQRCALALLTQGKTGTFFIVTTFTTVRGTTTCVRHLKSLSLTYSEDPRPRPRVDVSFVFWKMYSQAGNNRKDLLYLFI